MSNGYGRSAPAPITREQSIQLIVQACLDAGISNERQIAYVLATAQHESQNFSALEENYGRSQATTKGYEGGEEYFGRGYVHLTHNFNYQRMQEKLGIADLLREPQLAADPRHAANILAVGMRDGDYTQRRLSHYITDDRTDYVGARAIVNGRDQAEAIARLAQNWEKAIPELVRDVQRSRVTLQPTAAQQPDPVLRQGMANERVFEMQQYLVALNVTANNGQAISPDGDFGARSRQAVVRYQQQQGIEPADGVVSQELLQQMQNQVLQSDPWFKLKSYTAIHGPLNDNILSKGERGDPVIELKQQLQGLGYSVTLNGTNRVIYDEKTFIAVEKFQELNKIHPANGIADERTRDAINAAAVAIGLPETAEVIARGAEREEQERRQHQPAPAPASTPSAMEPFRDDRAQHGGYQVLFSQVLHQLHAAEQERGISAGPHSRNLAGMLTVASLREGITPDRVELNRDGSLARTVQFGPVGDDPLLNRHTQAIATAEAIQVPQQHSAQLGDSLRTMHTEAQQLLELAQQQPARSAMQMG